MGTYLTWMVHLSVSFIFAFSYCSWGSQGKHTEVAYRSILQWTTFCQNSPLHSVCLEWPYTAWLSLSVTRLWSMWSDWLIFCDFGFTLSALWCPLLEPTVLLGFLLPWTWGICSWLLQKNTATVLYLGQGVSPHCHPSWSWTWSSPSRPSRAHTATIPWTWIFLCITKYKSTSQLF